MSDIQAWEVVEIMDDGTERHAGTIRTPDAEQRAKTYAEKFSKDEGKNYIARVFNGKTSYHCGSPDGNAIGKEIGHLRDK